MQETDAGRRFAGKQFALRVFSAIVAAAVAAGAMVQASGQSSHSPNPPSAQTTPDTFAALRSEWVRDLHDKRVDESVAEYAADGEFIQPDGTRIRGTVALRRLFETITAMLDSDLEFYSWRVETVGDLAYDSGTYRERLKVRSRGDAMFSSGSYLTVYRHESGKWLIADQVWTGTIKSGAAAVDGLEEHPTVALTFDDLPAEGSLPPSENRTKILTKLAEALKANHLEGTYGFVNAVKLENDADAQQALRVWVDAGMNVGSHTWSHISLTDHTAAEFEEEIVKNEPALKEYAGSRDWHWFRYPFLWEGDTLEKRRDVRAFLFGHGYRVAQVSLDFEDYAWNDAYARCSAKNDATAIDWLKQSYLDTAAEYIKLGREEQQIAFGHEIPNVMLLHATAFTTLMLPDLLDLLHKQGFTLAALLDVERDPAYAADPDAALKYGGSLPDQFMDSRHLHYPMVKPKPFDRLKAICQ